jgi:hypothetical protein
VKEDSEAGLAQFNLNHASIQSISSNARRHEQSVRRFNDLFSSSFSKGSSQALETLSTADVLHFPDERQNSKIKELRLPAQIALVSGAVGV